MEEDWHVLQSPFEVEITVDFEYIHGEDFTGRRGGRGPSFSHLESEGTWTWPRNPVPEMREMPDGDPFLGEVELSPEARGEGQLHSHHQDTWRQREQMAWREFREWAAVHPELKMKSGGVF